MKDEMNIEEARPVLGDIVDRAAMAGEHFTITRNGRPRAVIVGKDWYESAQALIRGSQGRSQSGKEGGQ